MALADLYDGFLVDIDGVVLLGEDPLPGAVEALAVLAAAGKPYAFVTNNPRLSPGEHAEALRAFGIELDDDRMVTSAQTLVSLILEGPGPESPAVVIGTDSFRGQVEEAGIHPVPEQEWARAESVMVSGHEELTYGELRAASMAAATGVPFGATGRDPTMPMPDGHWPAAGACPTARRRAPASARPCWWPGAAAPPILRATAAIAFSDATRHFVRESEITPHSTREEYSWSPSTRT